MLTTTVVGKEYEQSVRNGYKFNCIRSCWLHWSICRFVQKAHVVDSPIPPLHC
jgi:hypothetical protein